ncbi:restriction endonuclease [Psychrobacter sp. FBL11]|uniref:Restriction endonuclease n=1 Tax=Psychrobacter saeujeotis TaxID=3143436 RepID=A0ABU9XAW6_9GAMM
MKIEVACTDASSTKTKGDLLENLAEQLLTNQSYKVIKEVRTASAELDLLCKHFINGKEIYVECKAQRNNIAAPTLRQLWGTVDSEDYAEGWIISTSEFTKDAKGFIEGWKVKPPEKATRLSFYGPTEIIHTLQRALLISPPPVSQAKDYIGDNEMLGDWVFLISEFGNYWCVYTLKGGAPFGVLVYHASNGKHVQTSSILNNLSKLDTPLADYDLEVGLIDENDNFSSPPRKLPTVIEVQVGESWVDYRPARPQDFVGRYQTQKDIFDFIGLAKNNLGTRVFAITGNSGLGKSSLIAKLRDKSRNQFYRNKYFIYAVDIRGASEPSYIMASLITALREAQKAGFGDKVEISLTDPSSPFNSPNIKSYIKSLEAKGQVVCLIFDQFEELYSKPELFGIFKAARSLMLDIAGNKSNFVLGFAWKTDSTTQQDHPAYHLWHELADHRKEYKLDVFDNGEISKSLTTFEKEVGQKISTEIRYQITQFCQGYPWLLKKLCINVYDSMDRGESADNILVNLDVKRLFEADLNGLTPQESTCLRLIANKAPADWSEIIELSGPTTLNSLVHKRLVVKSGDRLNIYWDIFKDFIVNDKLPIIPFNYVPSSDVISLMRVCKVLKIDSFTESSTIGNLVELKEKTIWNIGADLVMLGLAERRGSAFKVSNRLNANNEELILKFLREKFEKHSLKINIFKKYSGQTISKSLLEKSLKECLPKSKHRDKTWKVYTNRLIKYLISCGFLSQVGPDFIVQDSGAVNLDMDDMVKRTNYRRQVFSISASPNIVLENMNKINPNGFSTTLIKRNALTVLNRFGLVKIKDGNVYLKTDSISKSGGNKEALWAAAKNEKSIQQCIALLKDEPQINSKTLAKFISDEYMLNWSDGSIIRNGNILKQWSLWVIEGIESSNVPDPHVSHT